MYSDYVDIHTLYFY
ncbi:putative membrane protein, partial [Chlamydia psittaci 08-2626_L3]